MKNIKCFFVLLIVSVVTGARQKLLDPYRLVREKCQKQTCTTEEDIIKAKNNLQEVNAYLLCFADTLDVVEVDGGFNVENAAGSAVDVVPISIAIPLLQCCRDRVYNNEEACNRTYAELHADMFICYQEVLDPVLFNLAGFFQPPKYSLCGDCC